MTLVRNILAAATLTLASASTLAAQGVTVGGVVYAQYGAQLDSAPPGTNSNFDITRAYVNVIGRFSGGILTRVTGDVFHDGDVTAGGSLLYRLKYAYAAWTPAGSPLTYKLGLIHTPWLDWEESLWDYRMQGGMATDRNNYMSSADLGAGVDGSWKRERFNLQLGVYNGENYNRTPGDQHKDFSARLSYRLLVTDDSSRVGGLRLTGYAQLGTPTSGGTRNRFVGMLSYRSNHVTLAGEYVAATDTVTAPASAKKTGSIIGVFGVFHLPSSRLAVIARADIVDPNTANNTPATSNDRRTTVIVGLSYQLSPNVRLLADLDYTSLQGSVSGSATAPRKLTEALIQAQFVF